MNFWSPLQSRFRKEKSITALESWVGAANGGGNSTGLGPGLLKTTIKGKSHFTSSSWMSLSLVLSYPFSYYKVRAELPQYKLCPFSKEMETQKGLCPRHQKQLFHQSLNVSPGLLDCKWPFLLPHQKFNISSPEEPHRAPWAAGCCHTPRFWTSFANDVCLQHLTLRRLHSCFPF